MRFRIRASWGAFGSVESIVDGPVQRRERLRAFQAIPGLVELLDEPYDGDDHCGTWLDVPVPAGTPRSRNLPGKAPGVAPRSRELPGKAPGMARIGVAR